MSDKPVAGLLKKLVDILAAVLKGVIESKVKFEQGHGPKIEGPKS